jgi:hypothetical protein
LFVVGAVHDDREHFIRLDASHPYAYAARTDTADLGALTDGLAAWRHSGSDSQQTTIDPWRTDQARTDR